MKQKLTFNSRGYYGYPSTYYQIICGDFVAKFILRSISALPFAISVECFFKNPKKKGFKKIKIVEKDSKCGLFFINISGKPFLNAKGQDNHYIFEAARELIGSRREMWVKITCAD